VADPREEFSVGDYLRLAEQAIADIRGRGRVPLVVGGTGLYVRALTNGLIEGPSADWELRGELEEKEKKSPGLLYSMLEKVDPVSAAKIQSADIRRIIRALEVYQKEGTPISRQHEAHRASATAKPVRIAGLKRERTELYKRIEERVDSMMASGFLEEVKALRDMGCKRGMVSMYALGYKQILAHLNGETTLDEAVGHIKRDSKRYAKRQFTWFNAEPRVNWVDLSGLPGDGNALEEVKKALDIFPVLG
jgi:tRNA dimethylallyltransferase